MLLSDIAAALGSARIVGDAATEVGDVVHVAAEATPGALFACVVGSTVDGHALAPEAIARGAVALLVERELSLPVAQVVVPGVRAALPALAVAFFADPTASLRVVGVTGTNGKTTTAFLARSVIEAAGLPCGLLGTVEMRVGGVAEPVRRTTPEALELQRAFRRMLAAGDRACAMEVSSHALAIGRVDGVRFAAAAFTNLSQDHLDYHGSMEEYFAAKAQLFDGRCLRAVNADDPWARRLEAEVRFGIDAPAADVRAADVELAGDGSRFRLVTPVGERVVTTPLVGRFNVENALAAASLGLLVGVDLDAVELGLGTPPQVPGRMERVDCGQPFAVLVDYAHTPDALETVLRTARGLTTGRLHVVFGCGGDRDRAKRPLMGAAAAALADRVIVTSDNPRSEDPQAIVDEVVRGMPAGAVVVLDRRAAIARALADAAAGDVVVVAGKGHEQGQEAGGVVTPFDDRAVVREVLAS